MLHLDPQNYPALSKIFNKYPQLSLSEIKQALQILQESAFTAAELEYYDKYWNNIRVEATLIKDAKKMQAVETAKLLLLENVSKEIIIRVTGLTSDELDKL